jgi:hypothetical protein
VFERVKEERGRKKQKGRKKEQTIGENLCEKIDRLAEI